MLLFLYNSQDYWEDLILIFSDSSSETRLTAFELFFIYPWKTEDIVYGLGDWIYYPFTEIRLENGFSF